MDLSHLALPPGPFETNFAKSSVLDVSNMSADDIRKIGVYFEQVRTGGNLAAQAALSSLDLEFSSDVPSDVPTFWTGVVPGSLDDNNEFAVALPVDLFRVRFPPPWFCIFTNPPHCFFF